MSDELEEFHPPVISGRWVVIAMLLFGIAATGTMWGYWKLHLAPFYPLQRALADGIPGSSPRVEGGRHKQGPMTLRMVLRVPFKPVEGEPRIQETIDKAIALTKAHHDLGKYEVLEIHLVAIAPEQANVRTTREYKVADLMRKP